MTTAGGGGVGAAQPASPAATARMNADPAKTRFMSVRPRFNSVGPYFGRGTGASRAVSSRVNTRKPNA